MPPTPAGRKNHAHSGARHLHAAEMKIKAETGLAAWAVGTAWLILFILLQRMDPYWGEGPVDWLQAGSFLVGLALYPLFRKWFAAWLAKQR